MPLESESPFTFRLPTPGKVVDAYDTSILVTTTTGKLERFRPNGEPLP